MSTSTPAMSCLVRRSVTSTWRQASSRAWTMKRLAVPQRSYSKPNPAGCPGRVGKGVRVSLACCFDVLSRHSRTVSSSKSRSWTLSTSSMARTKSAFAFGGMHQVDFSPGLMQVFSVPSAPLLRRCRRRPRARPASRRAAGVSSEPAPAAASNRPASPASPFPRRPDVDNACDVCVTASAVVAASVRQQEDAGSPPLHRSLAAVRDFPQARPFVIIQEYMMDLPASRVHFLPPCPAFRKGAAEVARTAPAVAARPGKRAVFDFRYCRHAVS